MASRSNNTVNRECGSAHGSRTCRTPVLGALDARRAGGQERRAPARVQMPPGTLLGAGRRPPAPARSTGQTNRVRPGCPYPHVHPPAGSRQLDAINLPRSNQSQQIKAVQLRCRAYRRSCRRAPVTPRPDPRTRKRPFWMRISVASGCCGAARQLSELAYLAGRPPANGATGSSIAIQAQPAVRRVSRARFSGREELPVVRGRPRGRVRWARTPVSCTGVSG